MRITKLLMLLIAFFPAASMGGTYIFPEPDGSADNPSVECIKGEIAKLNSGDLEIVGISNSGNTVNKKILVTQKTRMFSVYGGLVFRNKLARGQKVKIWYSGKSCENPDTPLSAEVIVFASENPNDDWP